MSAKSTLSSIGTCLLGVVIVIALVVLAALTLAGARWVGEKILPWLMLLCALALALNIIILAPLAVIRPTRPWAGTGFFISSYLFGVTGWFMGLLLTLELWGGFAVVIGLFFMGIGVVPIAMLATLVNGMWAEFGLLCLAVLLTFGLRMLGAFLAETASGGPDAATYPREQERNAGETQVLEGISGELEEDLEDDEDEDWDDDEAWDDEEDEDSEDEENGSRRE